MAWQAATSGSAPLANHVNQFLVTHSFQVIYTGNLTSSQTTVGTGNATSGSTWLAQSFTTGGAQTTVGYVGIEVFPQNSSVATPPLTVAIYANSAGAPTGAALVSTTVSREYGNLGPAFLLIPTPVTGLSTSTTYWIVTQPAGSGATVWQWNKSNQASGASTSPNGTTWTAQTYGLLYQVFDQVSTTPALFTWEDGGVRWTWYNYNVNGTISQLAEYTPGQTIGNYIQSFRSLTYTTGQVTGVS